jgi:23S rRNA pseudouridine1911/1915/1917 synthase
MDEATNLEDAPKRIRLDLRLIHEIPELSRSFGTKLIQTGKVAVNGEVIDKPGYKLWPYDELEVDYDTSILDIIPDIELPIIYEDEDCVAIDKPTGVLTHTKGRLLA